MKRARKTAVPDASGMWRRVSEGKRWLHSSLYTSIRRKAAARGTSSATPCPSVFTCFMCSWKLHGSQQGCCASEEKSWDHCIHRDTGSMGERKGRRLGHTSHVQCPLEARRDPRAGPLRPGHTPPSEVLPLAGQRPMRWPVWRAVVLQICPTNHLPLIPHW